MNFRSGNDARFGRQAVAGSRGSRRAGSNTCLGRAGETFHWDEKHQSSQSLGQVPSRFSGREKCWNTAA